ncbi:MAG: hypothetical protein WKF55_13785 [Gemmatimonadaceae bacterium]
MRNIWALSAALALGACLTSPFAPDLSSVAGHYDLELVNGAPLPVPLAGGACPLGIVEGDISLAPKIINRRPLYTVAVYTRYLCETSRLPPLDSSSIVSDFGGWSLDGDRVEFRSEKGFDTYRVRPVQPTPSGTLGPVLILTFNARTYSFRRTRPDR